VTPNHETLKKRVGRCERLAADIGATVWYPVTGKAFISIRTGDGVHNCSTLRRVEKLLRHLKRRASQ
jgi:hypothetical protein